MTPTDICNMALSRLGEPRISDIDENTPRGISCRTHYEVVRDSLLRSHQWNFAVDRAALTEGAIPPFGWLHSYALPTDFLRLATFNGIEANKATEEYKVEGGFIKTDETTALITYVKRLTDPTLFDPVFVEVLTFRLASAVAMDITSDTAKRDEMEQLAALRMRDATFIDAGENKARVRNPIGRNLARTRGIPPVGVYPYEIDLP